jgi:hypothetical protein
VTVTADLDQFAGKKVIITRNLAEPNEAGETAVELEGKAESANSLGVLFKPKGKTGLELIEVGEIEDIRLAPETDKRLSAKTLKITELGAAKQHLIDRHGLTLTEVNGLDEPTAFSYHAELDHKGLDLGHVHGEKPAAERAAALESAAAEGGDASSEAAAEEE